MEKEYSALYDKFLSSKKPPGELLRNINILHICCNHHIILSTMTDPDLEDHEGRSTANIATITQTIVDVETCMMSSKTEHLLKILLKSKQLSCVPTKSAIYSQWTQFLDLEVNSNMHPFPIKSFLQKKFGRIVIVLAHHTILSAQINGTIMARGQEKAFEKSHQS
ncbi:hypothetical protein O181_036929 [Austropuccinia psidii MF-1]|uniref:Uncharacterized protein n=1 Tax=Austropuccinia psidii MF-1 TaxID=1389203 RepID=A0A9Q3HC11_9BASI|nr:hypothetical protein [Austropuccinia psidii MF-1]